VKKPEKHRAALPFFQEHDILKTKMKERTAVVF